ncbi:ATP-binding cassette domain-containing protein [Herminiimonas sp. CN]|uniref:ABC transporter ATP-binding protein n=1 Tax=Herminiimonas sp. CN TaxID=1349818 RepID=UPI0004736B53|nr:ATP-binding cassette domain-containing protein [Herminiimonas sp. CN]
MSDSSAVLQAEALCFGWPGHPLLNGWSARIRPGVTLVRGAESSGKTTLLRLLAGDLPAQSGVLQVNGVRLDQQPERYREQVFWTDPRSAALDAHSAAAWFQTLPRLHPRFGTEALAELVDGFSLAPHLDKPLYMLSTGSKRKVWLTAAFASGAAVTVIDEPFVALDRRSIGFLLGLLQDVAGHPSRAWVVADYAAPEGVPLTGMVELAE